MAAAHLHAARLPTRPPPPTHPPAAMPLASQDLGPLSATHRHRGISLVPAGRGESCRRQCCPVGHRQHGMRSTSQLVGDA